MNGGDLRDLVLAGVQWELTDFPLVMAGAVRSALAHDVPQVAPTVQTSPTRTQTSVVPPIAPAHPMAVDTAVAMAARPTDPESLNRMIAEFNHPLRAGATNVVLPHIASNPNGLVIITDIPSGDDDACGRILSGPAGELLDKMLAAIGLSRDNVSIVPLVFWRTPGGRAPTDTELALARPFVDRMVELLHPGVILTLGTLSASQIANVSLPRGHGMTVSLPSGITAMPIYHPNYLVLKPAAKRDAWTALQILQNLLKTVDK